MNFTTVTPKIAQHKKLMAPLIVIDGEFEFRQSVIPDVWRVTKFRSLKTKYEKRSGKLTRKWKELSNLVYMEALAVPLLNPCFLNYDSTFFSQNDVKKAKLSRDNVQPLSTELLCRIRWQAYG